jgi:hypothetical protein
MGDLMTRGVPWRRLGALAGVVLAVVAVVPTSASNNGTLKIHAQGTPLGTEDNDPNVCQFDVEAFNLDPGQEGELRISVQGGDEPTGTAPPPVALGPADADGYARSTNYVLQPGHYLAVLFGKDGDETLKAKSKVFKVTCDDGGGGGGGGVG